METPFLAFRYADKRNTFQVVRVIKYSSKEIIADLRFTLFWSGFSPIREGEFKIGYDTFRRKYKSIEKMSPALKIKLVEGIFRAP